MAAIVVRPRLEEGLADARQILFADADAVVLDRDSNVVPPSAALTVTLPPRSVNLMALEIRLSRI